MGTIALLYHPDDAAAAERVATELDLEGFTVDRLNSAAVPFRLPEYIAYVPLWSPASVTDALLATFAETATNRGALAPARIAPVEPPEEFAHVEAADLNDWNGNGADIEFQNLVTALRVIWSRTDPYAASEEAALDRNIARAQAIRTAALEEGARAREAAERARSAAKRAGGLFRTSGYAKLKNAEFRFEGEVKDGAPFFGVMSGPGVRYEGEMRGWERQGYGRTTLMAGEIYLGRCAEDYLDGPAISGRTDEANKQYCTYHRGAVGRLIAMEWDGGHFQGAYSGQANGLGEMRNASALQRGRFQFGAFIRPCLTAHAAPLRRKGDAHGVFDVFVSYSRKDAIVAERFAAELQAEGYRVWWDQLIETGEGWRPRLEHALQATSAVLLLWSASSSVSQWVRTEAQGAAHDGKLYVVRTDQTPWPAEIVANRVDTLEGWNSGEVFDTSFNPVWAETLAALQARYMQTTPTPTELKLEMLRRTVAEARRIGNAAQIAADAACEIAVLAEQARDRARKLQKAAADPAYRVLSYSDGVEFAGTGATLDPFQPVLGEFRLTGGNFYAGSLSGGHITGVGRFTFPESGAVIHGGARQGDCYGPCVLTNRNRVKTAVNFTRSGPHRLGVVIFPDGARYEGGIRVEMYEGLGRELDANGHTIRAGLYRNDQLIEPNEDAVRAFNSGALNVDPDV